jgi:pyrroloquinoline quinone biosynthesis protein B
MLIKILGSAAGGGFPQWNCACPNCTGFRMGTLRGKARTQTEIAFSPVEGVWFLVGASPDLRGQILAHRELSPSSEVLGHSPIAGVFLPSADVDAVMGLLHLREFQGFFVFATPTVQRILRNENKIFRVLDRADPQVQWQTLMSNRRIGCHLSPDPGDAPTFFYGSSSVGRNYPDYASEELRRSAPSDDACVGLMFEQDNRKLFVAPSISGHNTDWTKATAAANVSLLDGTFWSDEELLPTGRTKKTAREMGHLPLSGPEGLLAQYPKDARGRKILIHINNTNPILDENSDEHHAVVEAGFEIAYDGLTIDL